jgi:hypothetical protein
MITFVERIFVEQRKRPNIELLLQMILKMDYTDFIVETKNSKF